MGPRMEYILRNALLSLLDMSGSTLLDIPRILDDSAFRRHVLAYVRNDQVRRFWLREYESYPARFRAEAIAPIQNKVGEFLVNPILRNIIGQPKSGFDLGRIMDEGKILLVNLAKGKIGEDTASLLGAMLATTIGLTALSRADLPENERRDFYLYVDEFPCFTTTSFAGMLSEMRKYHVGLVLAHQNLDQLDESLRSAVLGNVGTMIAFRVGLSDAEVLEKEFYPEFSANDLVNLPNYHIYLRLMIDGVMSRPFSAVTLGIATKGST
jgi:Type IV secretion-system coupling protein DNA-binding domain